MHVLVACEFSGRVRDQFILRGHDAISCDLLPTEQQGPHITGDVRSLLHQRWDLIVAFPPCTYLAASGARWHSGTDNQREALEFVREIMSANAKSIAIENPVGAISTHIRKPDEIIQPWQFGHQETKTTCLWLKNLPLLMPTNIVHPGRSRVHYEPPGPDRWKRRSRTYPGIAKAMAEQWG